MTDNLVVVRGGGDLASGTVGRLVNCGFRVVVLETAQPTVIRRTVAFAQAVFDGSAEVEGQRAVKAQSVSACRSILGEHYIPVLVDPDCSCLSELRPLALVDAILAKRNVGTSKDMARIVVGLGPGFFAGRDVHAVVETNRGHNLGRVFYDGAAEPNTGTPGSIAGYTSERIVRSPAEGVIVTAADIGDHVTQGQELAHVAGVPVYAPLTGVLRGMIQSGIVVGAGMKIGDVDPRDKREYCYTVSEKARAIGGGVLEAIMHLRLKL